MVAIKLIPNMAGLVEKPNLVGDDVFLIEDSEADEEKKKVKLSDINKASLPKSGGDMEGDIGLEENVIKLKDVLSEDEKWSGISIPATLGSTVGQGELCFLASDGKWDMVEGILDGTDIGYKAQLGICLVAGNVDDVSEMFKYGTIRSAAFPAFTPGAAAYISDTAGEIQVAQPSTSDFAIRKVGFGITAEDLFFNPSPDYIVKK